jgi:hypothetical protein
MEEEDRNWQFEDERRAEREREHAPAPRFGIPAISELEGCNPTIGPDPVLLLVVQVPPGTEGAVVRAVARHAKSHSVTLMLWTRRPRRRQRRAMKLLWGRKLGKRLTG